MSVLMTLQVAGDPAKLEEHAAAHLDMMRTVADRARQNGLVSHHFYGTEGQIMILDEWESEEGFRRFFDASPEIAEMMRDVGVTERPEPRFWRRLETHDEVAASPALH